jgi:hypothetical protein
MATRVLHGIKFFEQFSKVTAKGTFMWSLDEIGLVVYEEMSFKVKVYGRRIDDGRTDDGRTADEKRSQKLTLSLCDRWAKKHSFWLLILFICGLFEMERWSRRISVIIIDTLTGKPPRFGWKVRHPGGPWLWYRWKRLLIFLLSKKKEIFDIIYILW